jgi:uncharacterized phiE125 gp8 family phage protein
MSVTVLTPALSYDLVTLAAAKAEMEVTGTSDDAVIASFIRQASATVSTFCQRVFPQETVTETFRLKDALWFSPASSRLALESPLYLSRRPVGAITNITDNGTVLTPDAYDLDLESGRLERLAGVYSGYGWWGVVSVTYTGGYPPGGIPGDLERAVMDLVKRAYFSRSRDPALRSEQVLDVINQSFTAIGSEQTVGGLPKDIADRLSPYRVL